MGTHVFLKSEEEDIVLQQMKDCRGETRRIGIGTGRVACVYWSTRVLLLTDA